MLIKSDLWQRAQKLIPGGVNSPVRAMRRVSSGTEAGMSALRLARGFTRRDRVIKFNGGYHGHADAFLAQAGSGLATLGIPASPGVPSGVTEDTIVCEYNDVDGVASAVE